MLTGNTTQEAHQSVSNWDSYINNNLFHSAVQLGNMPQQGAVRSHGGRFTGVVMVSVPQEDHGLGGTGLLPAR